MKMVLDSYELKAKIVPGLIVVFPILIDALYTAPVLNNWPLFTVSGLCGFALVYTLGQIAAGLGERIQPQLWVSWDGPPSTRFMRHRDRYFGRTLKGQIHEALERELGAHPLTSSEEAKNPVLADKEIEDAFRRVKDYLRARDPKGLWHSHNIEYGYSRNLLGCRWLWTFVAAVACAFAFGYGIKSGKGPLNPASVLDFVALCFAVYMGWGVLPTATKHVADGYGESAWMAFLREAGEPEQQSASTAS